MRGLFMLLAGGCLAALAIVVYVYSPGWGQTVSNTTADTIGNVGQQAADTHAAAVEAEQRRADTAAWVSVHATQTAIALEVEERNAALAVEKAAAAATATAIIRAAEQPPAALDTGAAAQRAAAPGWGLWYVLGMWGLPLLLLCFAGAGAVAVWKRAARTHSQDMEIITVRGMLDTEQARAANPQPVPHSYTHNPTYQLQDSRRIDYRGGQAGPIAPPALAADESNTAPADVPSFAALLQAGRIGKGQPLLLGYRADGGELWGSWEDLYSSAIGGISGSGKSWAACNLLAQSTMNGARLLLIDPDASNIDSLAARLAPLASRFVCDPAEDDSDIATAVSLAAREIERRRAAKGEQFTPLIVAIDEYAALTRGGAGGALTGLVEDIARRGRRLGIYAMCLSQVWQASRSGGGHTRDAFASAYLLRMRAKQAAMLTGLPARELPADILELPAGTGYLLSTRGELIRVAQPETTPGDMQQVAALLPDNLHSQAATLETGAARPGQGSDTGSGPEAAWKPAATAAASPRALSPQEAQILALARAATPISKIIEQVYGVKGGNRYQQHSQEVMRVIAENLQVREVGA